MDAWIHVYAERVGMDSSRMFLRIWVAFLALVVIICSCDGGDLDVGDQPVSEILAKFGLPIGLMPDSVRSYSLADDGSFRVELDKPCYVQFSYLVYYDKTITGKLSFGKISDLSGIEAREFFIWFDVTGIQMDLPESDFIYFHVGIISKRIEISWFETVPTCKKSVGNEPCNEIEKRAVE